MPQQVAPDKPAQPQAMQPLTGVTVRVTRFVFAGNTLLSSAELDAAVSSYLNRTLDFAQLKAAAAAVAEQYRKAGWVVRTYLPRQEVDQGVVTIQVVESVFGQLKFEGAPSQRVSEAQIARIILAQQAPGTPLNADRIDRGYLIANELGGVNLSTAMREGEVAQTTDVVVKVTDKPRYSVDTIADNAGATSTGRYRVSANAELRSPTGWGDLLSASLAHTEGSDYARFAYLVPLGAQGWRVGANVSQLQYRLVSADLAPLRAKGSSGSTGLEASYPMVRARQRNLNFTVNADAKAFDNQANGQVSTHYTANSVTLGLNGNLYDNWGGGGANFASVNWVSGRVNLNGSPNQASDLATARTEGGFAKLRYNASRQQVLTPAMALYAAYVGQMASKNLDSSEKMYLGGASGVRAYPTNEAGGSQGHMVNLELRAQLPQGFSLTGFYDWGQVQVNRDNSFAGAVAANRLMLKGAGLAVGWQSSFGLNLKATWARRIGHNPTATTAGNDQDGTLQLNRFWLTASMPF